MTVRVRIEVVVIHVGLAIKKDSVFITLTFGCEVYKDYDY